MKELLPAFSPEDIRQFVYCPRIIYFRYVLRHRVTTSKKMKVGLNKHEKWKTRIKERKLGMTRYYGVHLDAPNIGLFGIIDAVDYDGKSATPIELKTGHWSSSGIHSHHKAQLMAECMLVENALLAEVNSGILRYEVKREDYTVNYTDGEKIWISNALSSMRDIVLNEVLPEPTDKSTKCIDCEYYGVCLKV